jgi:hypothetical protein
MKNGFRLLLLALATGLLLAPPASAKSTAKPPSKALAKRLLVEKLTWVYKESGMSDDDLKITFKSFKILRSQKRKIDGGYYAKPVRVWPVKANVLITYLNAWSDREPDKRGWWNPRGREYFMFYRERGTGWTWASTGA